MINGIQYIGKELQAYSQELYKRNGPGIYDALVDSNIDTITSYLSKYKEDEEWLVWVQENTEEYVIEEPDVSERHDCELIEQGEQRIFRLVRENKGWRWVNRGDFDNVISGVIETTFKTEFSRAAFSGDYKQAAMIEKHRQANREKTQFVEGSDKLANIGGVQFKTSKKKADDVSINAGGISFTASRKNKDATSTPYKLSPNGVKIYENPKKHPLVMNRTFIVDRANPDRLDPHYNDLIEWVPLRDHYNPQEGNYCGYSEGELINIVIEYCRRYDYFDWSDHGILIDCLHTLKGKIYGLYEDLLDELDRLGFMDFSELPYDISIADPILYRFGARRKELKCGGL